MLCFCISVHLPSCHKLLPPTLHTTHTGCGAHFCVTTFEVEKAHKTGVLSAVLFAIIFTAMQAGYCVLVHSAAGGCGLNALAICLAVGAVPVGTVGSQDKVSTPLLHPIAAPFHCLTTSTFHIHLGETCSKPDSIQTSM